MAVRKLFAQNKRRDVDMTSGNIVLHLLYFAFPLLLGNVFQQLYNMVDTWVVGNFVGNTAFSAVGSVGPITNLLIGFFGGLASGAGAVISQYYGAKQEDRVRDAVHTTLLMTLGFGVLFTVIGVLMTPLMLGLMGTPEDVFSEASTYLTIYFSGMIGLMLYNVGAGILRAVGDSKRPFYFLVVSAILNTVLDLLFVLAFGMGVAGVALATIIAQAVSAGLVILTLIRAKNCVRIDLRAMRLDFGILGKIFKVGIPAALQMAITSFSNIFVQSYIYDFGADGMSGWTAYSKIDQLILLPMQSVALASTTFVAQNLGSHQEERAREGVTRALLISMASTAVLMLPVMIFAPHLVWFFNKEAKVIAFGTLLLRWISPFYLLCCVNQILAGALRGAGNSRAPMIIMLSSFVFLRQIFLYVTTYCIIPWIQSFTVLEENVRLIMTAMSYPLGWLGASVLMFVYYSRAKLMATRLVECESDSEQLSLKA